MRLSLKIFVVVISLHGMILPNENIQSTSFSSYLRGAALFCAGMVCMKGTSYLYQRYWSPKSKPALDAARRSMSMPSPIASNISVTRQDGNNNGSLAKLKPMDSAPLATHKLYQSIEIANKLIAAFDAQWKPHREGLCELQKDINRVLQVNQSDGSAELNNSQKQALQEIREVYRRQIDNRTMAFNVEQFEETDQEEIASWYAIFSAQKSNKSNFFRRLSSVFGTLTRTKASA